VCLGVCVFARRVNGSITQKERGKGKRKEGLGNMEKLMRNKEEERERGKEREREVK